jgi:hypothetical protein
MTKVKMSGTWILFICGSFNNTAIIADCVASNGKKIPNNACGK